MLDIKFIRENKDLVAAGARKKHLSFDVEKLIEADEQRKKLLGRVEEKRADQNVANNQIVKAGSEERAGILERMGKLKEELEKEETELKEVMKEWRALMLLVPNVPDSSVPEGEGEKDNVVKKTWGEK